MTLLNCETNPKELSPQTLAFVGDSVYDLLVREALVCEANRPVGALNHRKVQLVRCESQAEAIEKLLPELSEEETDVYKRGRNAFTRNTPKNSSVADYHKATGLEALFGYLYLSDRMDRVRELYGIINNE